MNSRYNILVIGAVSSTIRTTIGLVKNNLNIVGILGHEPSNTNAVSGLANLKKLALENNIDYCGFQKINAEEHIQWAKSKQPDIIFAVGFSQLLTSAWLEMPTLGCIGFHPTCLPKGRGRAPLAWTILEERCASATFFLMGEGADDGPIFVQKKFLLTAEDDASSVETKINLAIDQALDQWLPELKQGKWNPVPQDEASASWFGRRTPDDGIINWHESAYRIDRLIKASTHPHPGAFTFWKKQKINIWCCEIEETISIKGVIGRILLNDKNRGYLVQCGEGLLWINNLTNKHILIDVKVGDKLGFYTDLEIFELWQEIEALKHEK